MNVSNPLCVSQDAMTPLLTATTKYDDLPSIEELLGPILRKGISTGGCRNSEDTFSISESLFSIQVEVVSVQQRHDWVIVQVTAGALEVCASALRHCSKQSLSYTQTDR